MDFTSSQKRQKTLHLFLLQPSNSFQVGQDFMTVLLLSVGRRGGGNKEDGVGWGGGGGNGES